MKPIKPNELYEHLGLFLKAKGIEFKEGSYTSGIQKGCSILTDAINLGQKGLGRAKTEMDKALEQMRQTIHEKTAPKSPPAAAAPPKPPPARSSASAKKRAAAPKSRKGRAKKSA